jgi:futalosine hydrolase
MILAVAATEFEMAPFHAARGDTACRSLVCGVGPVESCLQLTRFLQKNRDDIVQVVNFGVAGAYTGEGTGGPALLDICLAETEVLGDLGICFPRRLDDLPQELSGNKSFTLDSELRKRALVVLANNGISAIVGNFVTVSCASGTGERGEMLREKYDGLCENMEGAAIARVCADFDVPLLQIRCVSNYVEDRDPARWCLRQACEKSGRTAALLLERR